MRLAPLITERLDAELDVVGVLPNLPPMDYGFGLVYAGSPDQEAGMTHQLTADLEAQLARSGLSGATPIVRSGQPAIEIANTARATHASLILVGLGPHHALDRALGHETALQLVQVASTPVLAVPSEATTLPRRVVVGVDFTPSSVLAARTASLLLAPGDTLHLVHVSASTEPRLALERPSPAANGGMDLGGRLAALVDTLNLPRDVIVEQVVIEHGTPSGALLDEIAKRRADLVALGSHGYGLWKRLTLGSVASKILRLATTSVLVQPIGSVTSPTAMLAAVP